ncbi:hypothetical protein NFI96_029714 [Prochilodus magdalenae]|nr:hypothetical protein NFI96_029714 [Prochilodus magdalenae]
MYFISVNDRERETKKEKRESVSSFHFPGLGLPLIGQSDASDPEPSHRVRTKRCSCNNQLDSECHYFCHLDIVWVTTPSKTTVYGLGSPIARRRRSTDRCLCANPADRTCNSFCVHSSKNAAAMLMTESEPVQGNPNLQPALENSDNVEPVVIVEGPEDRAVVLTFIRSLMKAKFRAMKRNARHSERGFKTHKPVYS